MIVLCSRGECPKRKGGVSVHNAALGRVEEKVREYLPKGSLLLLLLFKSEPLCVTEGRTRRRDIMIG